MKQRAAAAILALLAGAAAAQSPPPPSPAAAAADAAFVLRQDLYIVRFTPGVATCGGVTLRDGQTETPQATIARHYNFPLAPALMVRDVALRFAIDASGRTIDIDTDTSRSFPSATAVDTGDVHAALAASHFAPAARSDCQIVYQASAEPFETAPEDARSAMLASPAVLSVTPAQRRALSAVAGATCQTGTPPRPLELHFVDRRTLHLAAGNRGWAVVRYDIAADGRTRGLMIANSSGDASLDRAATAAVAASRFESGRPLGGCYAPVGNGGGSRLAAPADVDPASLHQPGDTCPADAPDPLQRKPPPYPDAFRRRSIEGWALIRFDVAPWGAIGNVSVAAAEPAAAFGEQAAALVRGAIVREAGKGLTGCIVRVRYRISDDDRTIDRGD